MSSSGLLTTSAAIRAAGDGMNNRTIRTRDGRVYYCAECPYRNLITGFCGFCMRKILDDMKKKTKEDSGDGVSVTTC